MDLTLNNNDMDKNEHFYEAYYQTWMLGGNPDKVSYDKSEDDFYNGFEPDYTAQMEVSRQQQALNEQLLNEQTP